MSAAVEILVPQAALPQVKRALGPLPSASFHTQHSQASCRMLLSPLAALDSPNDRHVLESLIRTSPRNKPLEVVLLAFVGAAVGLAAIEAFGRLSRQARRDPYIAPDRAAVRRMVLARCSNAEKDLIASASVEDGKLVVWSCEPTRYEVSVGEIPALSRLNARALPKFEVSPSGSRIRWPDGDVDINLDTIREHADPKIRQAHEVRARQEAARYAGAIRRFREESSLTQSQISGLSERQVRRLEEGDTIPHMETLAKLAAAHRMPVGEYLQELARRSGARAPKTTSPKPGR